MAYQPKSPTATVTYRNVPANGVGAGGYGMPSVSPPRVDMNDPYRIPKHQNTIKRMAALLKDPKRSPAEKAEIQRRIDRMEEAFSAGLPYPDFTAESAQAQAREDERYKIDAGVREKEAESRGKLDVAKIDAETQKAIAGTNTASAEKIAAGKTSSEEKIASGKTASKEKIATGKNQTDVQVAGMKGNQPTSAETAIYRSAVSLLGSRGDLTDDQKSEAGRVKREYETRYGPGGTAQQVSSPPPSTPSGTPTSPAPQANQPPGDIWWEGKKTGNPMTSGTKGVHTDASGVKREFQNINGVLKFTDSWEPLPGYGGSAPSLTPPVAVQPPQSTPPAPVASLPPTPTSPPPVPSTPSPEPIPELKAKTYADAALTPTPEPVQTNTSSMDPAKNEPAAPAAPAQPPKPSLRDKFDIKADDGTTYTLTLGKDAKGNPVYTTNDGQTITPQTGIVGITHGGKRYTADAEGQINSGNASSMVTQDERNRRNAEKAKHEQQVLQAQDRNRANYDKARSLGHRGDFTSFVNGGQAQAYRDVQAPSEELRQVNQDAQIAQNNYAAARQKTESDRASVDNWNALNPRPTTGYRATSLGPIGQPAPMPPVPQSIPAQAPRPPAIPQFQPPANPGFPTPTPPQMASNLAAPYGTPPAGMAGTPRPRPMPSVTPPTPVANVPATQPAASKRKLRFKGVEFDDNGDGTVTHPNGSTYAHTNGTITKRIQ
jgi:hypothetical protein